MTHEANYEPEVKVHKLMIPIIPSFIAIGLTAVRIDDTVSVGVQFFFWKASIALSLQSY